MRRPGDDFRRRRSRRYRVHDGRLRHQPRRPRGDPDPAELGQVRATQLDQRQAAKAVKLIRQQEKAFHRKIPYAILFTRTSAAIRPRTLQHIQDEFQRHGVDAFRTHITEREAFRAIFSFGGTLESLSSQQVSNLHGAIANARAFAAEAVALLRQTGDAAEVRQPEEAA